MLFSLVLNWLKYLYFFLSDKDIEMYPNEFFGLENLFREDFVQKINYFFVKNIFALKIEKNQE